MILIGKIRNEATAFQTLQASINGYLLIATIYASDIVQAIERLQTFCNGRASNKDKILTEGLTAVIWQALEKNTICLGRSREGVRFLSKPLVFKDPDFADIRVKIHEGLNGK